MFGNFFMSPKMLELLFMKLYPLLKEGDSISIVRKKNYVEIDLNGQKKQIYPDGRIIEIEIESNNENKT